MKRVLLIITTLVGLSLPNVFAQKAKAPERHRFLGGYLYGDVKTVTTKYSELKDYFGEIKKVGSPKVSVYHFNLRGDCVDSVDYDTTGSMKGKSISKYNSDGNLVEQASYDYDGSLLFKFIYKYTPGIAKPTEFSCYNADGSLWWKSITKYDSKGNEVETTSWNSDGSLRYKLCYTYDSNGNNVEVATWEEYGLSGKTTRRYDSNNNVVEEIRFDANDSIVWKNLYTYDEAGNEIRKECYNSDSSLSDIDIYTYNLGGNVTERASYNADGSLKEKISHKYDSHGNMIESICFKSDAMIPSWLEEREIVYFSDTPKQEVVEDNEPPYLNVEVMPSFMGGDLNTFRAWVAQEFVIPAVAAKNGIQGRVVVQFVIEKDGRLTNIEFLQSPDRVYEEEVRRVLNKSPRWTPGRQRDGVVRVKYILPINCTLQ